MGPTTSIDIGGDGQPTTPWTPAVRRSLDVGNTLEQHADGLFVGEGVPSPIVVADSASVDISGDGTVGSPVSAALWAVPFLDAGWVPSQAAGAAGSYANVATNPTRDVVIPRKGWLRVAFSAFVTALATGGNMAFRFVPMTSGGAVDTAITQYDQFRLEGLLQGTPGSSFMALTAAWYIPTARSMKVGAQYHRNGASGSVNINAAVTGSAGLVPAVITYTPDLT